MLYDETRTEKTPEAEPTSPASHDQDQAPEAGVVMTEAIRMAIDGAGAPPARFKPPVIDQTYRQAAAKQSPQMITK